MKIILLVVCVVCITIIELFAIHKGLDGVVLAGSISAVAGIAGYHIRGKRDHNVKVPQDYYKNR